MNTDQIQIMFHGVEHSDALEDHIKKKINSLEKFAGCITGCRVVVESPHKHAHKGRLYEVLIDLTLPGHEIVVNRHSQLNHSHEDVYVAISDSFKEVKRRLQDSIRHDQTKARQSREIMRRYLSSE